MANTKDRFEHEHRFAEHEHDGMSDGGVTAARDCTCGCEGIIPQITSAP